VRQFLWLALLSTPTRYGGPSLWRPFAMADPNRSFGYGTFVSFEAAWIMDTK